jgi:hypothetical protein
VSCGVGFQQNLGQKSTAVIRSIPSGHGNLERMETAMPWKVEIFRLLENILSTVFWCPSGSIFTQFYYCIMETNTLCKINQLSDNKTPFNLPQHQSHHPFQ